MCQEQAIIRYFKASVFMPRTNTSQIREDPETEIAGRTVADENIVVYAAKRGFLKLLIRCRRIILQDSAVYLILKRENDIVNTYPSVNNFSLGDTDVD
ncbi:hypothetical protein [Parasitella parasitica]|uniref:Uncharacterized protein n=1 Tax=Parasitella parasitica TaxID=35722 RepID=A0A0B7MU82_9FUNG|nr:hypothetical protein [Parasitella parasitica]